MKYSKATALFGFLIFISLTLFGCEDQNNLSLQNSLFTFTYSPIFDETEAPTTDEIYAEKTLTADDTNNTDFNPSTTVAIAKITTLITDKQNVATEKITNKNQTLPETAVSTETTVIDFDNKIIILKSPGSVKKGSKATLEIKGRPNTEYSIKVKYSSGYSSAKGLENTTTDEYGKCSWTWRVGGSTKTGTYEIKISDGENTFSLTFDVV